MLNSLNRKKRKIIRKIIRFIVFKVKAFYKGTKYGGK